MKIRIQSSSSVKLPQSICSYWLLRSLVYIISIWSSMPSELVFLSVAILCTICSTLPLASKLHDWEMSHCLTLSQMAPAAHAQTLTLMFPECCCFFSFMECPYLFNYKRGILQQLPFLTITDVSAISQLCLNADRQWWPLITIQLDSVLLEVVLITIQLDCVLLEVAMQLCCCSREMKYVPGVQHSIRIANYRFKTWILMHN